MTSESLRFSVLTPAESSPQLKEEVQRVLTPEAIQFLVDLHAAFELRRQRLLESRAARLTLYRDGALPDFNPDTRSLRESDWSVAPIPDDLLERRVEITGPADKKTMLEDLNSGADTFLADFEDSNSPTWENMILGQANLIDVVRRNGILQGKMPGPVERPAIALMVRPRGWHLTEKHFLVGEEVISASLFDMGLFLFHNASTLRIQGSAPYVCLPKLESHLEARLWDDVFVFSQKRLHIPHGTIRATAAIETVPAAFAMNEILWELRAHSSGLSCGRWDYLFSFIKIFSQNPLFTLPDRLQITMEKPLLKSLVALLIHTCHRRGVHAIGSMTAQIPVKSAHHKDLWTLDKVRHDKLREVRAGYDGTRVAHSGLVPVAREVFKAHHLSPHQLSTRHDQVNIRASDLLTVPEGTITEEGLRQNVSVSLQYLASWLGGMGRLPLHNMMEDTGTAEISRAQLWQWVKHGAKLAGGRTITRGMVQSLMEAEMRLTRDVGVARGGDLLSEMVRSPVIPEFLTVAAYKYIR